MLRVHSSRRSHREDSAIASQLSQLSLDVCRILDRLREEALVPLNVLAGELTTYTSELERQARTIEFYDFEAAKRAATLCHKLLAALPEEPSKQQHRLVQLAISYFVLAEDAQDDNYSLVGFDDDLKVIEAVIAELGLDHLLRD
jgi:uncharacterized membrane protein YkvA (DUF1232 family)